jgi:hypothetical protein
MNPGAEESQDTILSTMRFFTSFRMTSASWSWRQGLSLVLKPLLPDSCHRESVEVFHHTIYNTALPAIPGRELHRCQDIEIQTKAVPKAANVP